MHPLRTSVAGDVDDINDATFTSIGNAAGLKVETFAEFRDRFNSDAEFRARIVGTDAHEDSP